MAVGGRQRTWNPPKVLFSESLFPSFSLLTADRAAKRRSDEDAEEGGERIFLGSRPWKGEGRSIPPTSRYIPGSFSAPPRNKASVSPTKKGFFFRKKFDDIEECVRLSAWCSSGFLWSQIKWKHWRLNQQTWLKNISVTYFCGNTLKSESNIYSPNLVVGGIILSGIFDKFSLDYWGVSIVWWLFKNKSEMVFSNPVSTFVCLLSFLFFSSPPFFADICQSEPVVKPTKEERRILLPPLFSLFISSVIDTFVLPFLLPPFFRHPKKHQKVLFF